ncbi:MAG: PspA-associated protein PspAA [Frankiaceae bacterium]
MIIRILGRGQFEVDEGRIAHLNELDSALAEAVESGDEDSFRAALGSLIDAICGHATPVADDALMPSDIVLPDTDASIEDVRELLGDEGLIPG